MQIYQAIVEKLETIGVDTAFEGNGENIASLAVALKHSRIRAIATRHEQAAACAVHRRALHSAWA